MRLPPEVLTANPEAQISFLHTSNDPRDGDPLRGALRPTGPVKLTLSETALDGATMISIRGELDLLTAPKVSARLDRVMRRRREDVIIDLAETDFVDSAGLYVLLNAKRRLTRLSRRLSVVCPDGPVRRVLELSRLTETLGVVDSLETPAAQAAGNPARPQSQPVPQPPPRTQPQPPSTARNRDGTSLGAIAGLGVRRRRRPA